MKETDIKFLENAFKKYYFEHSDLIRVPERTIEREFGYQKFNSGMTRHLSIKSDEDLRLMLITKIPSDVYCSNAYYSFPNLPMNEKDFNDKMMKKIEAANKSLDRINKIDKMHTKQRIISMCLKQKGIS